MALCPSGHQSATSDYCDTCGAPIGGAALTPTSAALPPPASSAASTGAAAAEGGTCPACGARRDGRFCEECGYDYELASLLPPPANQSQPPETDPLEATVALPPDFDLDAEFEAAEQQAAAQQEAAQGRSAAAAPDVTSPSSGSALTALVTADFEYYSGQVDRGEIDRTEYPFPKYPNERRFVLGGDRVRIGRVSSSRGIVVEIDLTGPPMDPAVSHLHAQLIRTADGTWAVVDLNSANGTRLNGAADPMPPETEIPIAVGDRIHLGVWTTLTLTEP